MNSNLTDRFVPLAETAILETTIVQNDAVSSEMAGYVSTFCVDVKESLPMAVLSFNKADKKKVPLAVNTMLKLAQDQNRKDREKSGPDTFPGLLGLKISEEGLYYTVKDNPSAKKLLRDYCLCCAVAIKLVLQLYKE